MSEQRLSKLQKFILKTCLEEVLIRRDRVKSFYPEVGENEQSSITRSIKNLVEKGLISPRGREYSLTEAGLKEIRECMSEKIDFKDYKRKIEEVESERGAKLEETLKKLKELTS